MPNYKILLIAPAWVGDVVMSQTLLKLLKKQYQGDIQIDVFASKFLHPLLLRMPEIHTVLENPFLHKELNLVQRIKVGLSLRKYKYDEVIVLPNSLKSALVPFFAKIKKRTGFIGEKRYILLNNIYKLDKIALPLMIERFCALAIGGQKAPEIQYPQLTIDKENQQHLFTRFKLEPQKKLVVFCPAAEYGPAKRWPPEYFGRLATLLGARDVQIIILGSAKDREIAKDIIESTSVKMLDLCGQTTLADTIDLLAQARFVITNDSGLMHIATSVNDNVIAIYGSTSDTFTPPLNPKAQVIKTVLECAPCFERTCKYGHYNCLKLITPEVIRQKICL